MSWSHRCRTSYPRAVDAPYRIAEVRAEASTIRYSPWLVSMWLLSLIVTLAFTTFLFIYVANGWIGYVTAGCVALYALLMVRGYRAARVSQCPRCGVRVDVPAPGLGYLCTCHTFLETERDSLLASPESRLADTPVFGVANANSLHMPMSCCMCLAPTTRTVTVSGLQVPHCEQHDGGAAHDGKEAIKFRSLDYATRVREQNNGTFVGRPLTADTGDTEPRWSAFGSALLMFGLAAAAFWGLGYIEDSNYIIVPASLKGLVLWLLVVIVGRVWLSVSLVAGGLMSLGSFVASFRPSSGAAGASRTQGPAGSSPTR